MRRRWRRTWWACLFVSIGGGSLCLPFFLLWLSPETTGHAGRSSTVAFLVVFVIYIGVLAPVTSAQDRRRTAAVESWLDRGRPPNARGRAIVLREPWRQATTSFLIWSGGSIAFAAIYFFFVGDLVRSLVLLVGAELGGLNIGATAFLVCERGLRPLAALALEDGLGGHGAPRSLSVRSRLLVAWVTGSGIPLLGIALALVWQSFVGHTDMTGPLWALVITGVFAGWVVVGTAARAVAEPVERVRAALLQVRTGDLDASVAVDDASEIGLLQTGFNRMVASLRENRRLHDLFGRHVGAEVARQAITRDVDFSGEAGEATIVFVDLIGSTAMVETRSAHEVMAYLNVLFAAVVRSVQHEGGWVSRFQGDAALCVFGAPAASPDHAARAVRAVEALCRELTALRAAWPDLDTGIGVSSGVVVTGNLGADSRYEFGIVGDPANEAARLSDEAKRRTGRVLASSATIAAAGDEIAARWRLCDVVSLRGRSTASLVYEPTAVTPHGSAVAVPDA